MEYLLALLAGVRRVTDPHHVEDPLVGSGLAAAGRTDGVGACREELLHALVAISVKVDHFSSRRSSC